MLFSRFILICMFEDFKKIAENRTNLAENPREKKFNTGGFVWFAFSDSGCSFSKLPVGIFLS